MIFGVKSDMGNLREKNEDSYNIISGYDDVPGCFLIADGMGGHSSGEIASKLAVNYASEMLMNFKNFLKQETDVSKIIEKIMSNTNTLVFKDSEENRANYGMGTTLIISIILQDKLYIGHIGDSRVYLIRGDRIERLTIDHSYVEELIMNGSITLDEAKNHPKKNIITRALGCYDDVKIDTYKYCIEDLDVFLMCTDGLTNMVSESDILKTVKKYKEPQKICDELINIANQNGGEDNITVILFK